MNTTAEQDFFSQCLAVVSALPGTGSAPASSIYLALGSDIEMYERVVGTCQRLGLVTRTSTEVSLSEKGREVAAQVDTLLRRKS